jgi:hypothetical protein
VAGRRARGPDYDPGCVCDYGRRIRVAPNVLAAGSITRGVCDTTGDHRGST